MPDCAAPSVSSLEAGGPGDRDLVFSGIPGGHEFNSLILAILQASGNDIKLDDEHCQS